MALTCTTIASSQVINCNNLPVAGNDVFLYLFNLSDKGVVTQTGGVISAITLAGAAVAYKWEGANDFVLSTYSIVTSRILNGFAHRLEIVAPNDSQIALNELKNLANGRVVGITSKFGSVENTFRVHGLVHGLQAIEVTGDDSNADSEGLPTVALATPEGKKEPLPPQHLLDTDYATTLAALEALLT